MKYRLLIAPVVLIALLALALPAFAQGGSDSPPQLITLNDATPGIDAVINLPANASGAVVVELDQAAITLTDSAGNIVFQMADPRAHALELRLAPNSGAHTLSAERLPGVAVGYVIVQAQADLTVLGAATLVNVSTVQLQQQFDLPLSQASPSGTTTLDLPAGTTSTVAATFPGAPVTMQVVDASGLAVATLYGGGVDGLHLTMDGGSYAMTLLNRDPAQSTLASVSVQPASPSGLATAISAQQPVEVAALPAGSSSAAQAEVCTFTVTVPAGNTHSGPGTGYSILGYAFQGEQYPVGGLNAERTWVLAGVNGSGIWMDGRLGILSPNCANLTVYDIATQNAVAPSITMQQSQGFNSYDDEGEDEEHEDYEDEEHEGFEHEDDD